VSNIDFYQFLGKFNPNAAIDSRAIVAAAGTLKVALPDDFSSFLTVANGGEGMIGDNYLILWRTEELAELNDAYQVSEYAPGLLIFGSDGGGEAFAFDTRCSPWSVVKIPFVGMDLNDARPLASSFAGFLSLLQNG